MTIIPVLWISWHDDIIPRGYADQGFLETVLAREVWTPPNALTFEHVEVRSDFPNVEGAVVILPARHHTSDRDVRRFLQELDRLKWSLVILSGDEQWEFPWAKVKETPTRKVWIMQPRPEHTHLSGFIPGGWYQETRNHIPAFHNALSTRPLNWMFAGQITHSRRESCAEVLRQLDNGFLHETAGYLQGIPRGEYFDKMADAKVIPCPSGPMTVDTARPLEALEAGCVPVVDMVTPRDEKYDYWELCFPGNPFTRIWDWNDFPAILQAELDNWPQNSNRVFSFWQQWKRRITLQLDNDIRAVMGLSVQPTDPNNLISAIITTSPCPGHPSTDDIEEVINSIREQLPTSEIVVVCDGVRPEDSDLADSYHEYIHRLLWHCNFSWHNVVPIVLDEWGHQANATRAALELVNSPFLLFMEHDTPITGDIPWQEMCEVIESGEGNLIQLHFNESIHPDHRSILLDDQPITYSGIPLHRTVAYWQRPHLASTNFYHGMLDEHFPPTSRTMIEDRMYGIVHCDTQDLGMSAAWERWKMFLYAPEGNMIRSRHLDSRQGHPKGEMWNE